MKPSFRTHPARFGHIALAIATLFLSSVLATPTQAQICKECTKTSCKEGAKWKAKNNSKTRTKYLRIKCTQSNANHFRVSFKRNGYQFTGNSWSNMRPKHKLSTGGFCDYSAYHKGSGQATYRLSLQYSTGNAPNALSCTWRIGRTPDVAASPYNTTTMFKLNLEPTATGGNPPVRIEATKESLPTELMEESIE